MATQYTKRLYALASGLELVERNNKDDPFHILVHGITGKTSVKDLTDDEKKEVEAELLNRMKLSNHNVPLKTKAKTKTKVETQPGMMTAAQQTLAWRLIYRLMELDATPKIKDTGVPYTARERMDGAIDKILGVTPNKTKNPYVWVDFKQGEKLIEVLKKYVRSAERKQKKAGVG